MAVRPVTDHEGPELSRLRVGLRVYGALWTVYFVLMGLTEFINVVPHDSTLGSLIMWGQGQRGVVLMLVAINVVIGIALFRSAGDPLRHRSGIDLALAINATHLTMMAALAFIEPHGHIHLIGDVPAGLIPTAALWVLWLPVREVGSPFPANPRRSKRLEYGSH